MKRLLWIVLLVAALAGGGWYALQLRRQAPATPTFTTAKADVGDVVQTITATGQLEPVTNVEIGSQISGLIKELLADFNSPVTAGQVVARLDDSTFRANLMSAEGNLAQAKAALQLATVLAKRNRELLAQGSISQTVLDQSEADLARTSAAIQVSEAAVARAKIDLERCTIYSPVDGIVISRAVDVGQTVAASLNAPVLFTIAADLSKMQIIANVAEAEIGQIEVGQRVLFTVDAFAGRPFFGSVSQIRNSPRTVDNVVTYDTVIAVANSEMRLKPGMTANVQIVTAERNGVVRVPNSALRVRLTEGQFKPADNTTGPRGTGPAPTPNAPGAQEAGTPAIGGTSNGTAPANAEAVAANGERPAGGRRQRGERGGGEGGAGAPAALMRQFREKSGSRFSRTAYVLPEGEPTPGALPQAVQVRVGVTDGQFTEILGGIEEGSVLVTGIVADGNTQQQQRAPQGASPFGGGGGQGGGRMGGGFGR